MKSLWLGLSLVIAASTAEAAVTVVATTPCMGALVREVGGQAVSVTVLAPPDRDVHYLIARPSMMVALRRADLLVAVGADLEVGWLPAAIQGAANGKILPGQPGYFEGAAQIDLLEKGQAADRSRGDVHPMGNPHYCLDPERMAGVATALARRLATFDPAGAATFAANASAFARAVADRVPRWKAEAAGAPGVVLYHKDSSYLAALLGIPVLGYIEPIPGVPPTAAHLSDLVRRLTGSKGVVISTTFQPRDGPEFLRRNLGWSTTQLPLEVPVEADGQVYLDHIDRWARAMSGRTS
jgi:zinc/manganese transport system substrate-binding protein